MTIIITILYIIHINVIMIIKYMLKHDFAKKKKEKTMLYIFRYFKEIQKSIFVIKTMLKCVRNFHTFYFISPFRVSVPF